MYEPANDDQIPEEEHSVSEDRLKSSSDANRSKSKVKARPNLFAKKTTGELRGSGLYFRNEAQEPGGDDGHDILSDNNGEVTEFVGSYDQVQEISENQTCTVE